MSQDASGVAERGGRLGGLPAAALLAGLVFLFQPAQVYQYNGPFFPIGLKQFAPVLVPMFLAAFALLAAITAAGRPRWREWSAALLGGLAIAAWATSTFFTASRGILDGRSVLLIAGAAEAALDTAAFAAFLAGGTWVAYRWPGHARRLFLAFFVLLSVHAAWVAATDAKPWQEDSAPRYDRLATLSAERNVLVFLLDSFQSDFLAEIVSRDPPLAAALDGFTFFPNAISPSPTTYLAMPAIHSGGHFVQGDNIRGLYDRTVVNNSFVSRLADAGYDAMLVNNVFDWCPRGAACALSDHMTGGQPLQVMRATALMLNLSVFRMAPDVAKKAIYRGGAWWIPDGLEMNIVQSSNGLLERLATDLHGGLDKPAVRFLHLFSSHAPARVDADCRPVLRAAWSRENAIAQGRCALRKVEAVLATLKARGLYDASAIVILADHGTGMSADTSGFNLGASASPVLLVKPFGARGSLRTSDKVVGLADVPATVCAMPRACKADWGSDVMAPADRPPAYPFVEYTWQGKFFGAESLPITNLYEIRGPPRDVESWWRLTNMPTGTLPELSFSTSDPPGAFAFGWSALETGGDRDFRWTMGPMAGLYLDLDESKDARLQFDVSTHGGNAGQVMAVEVNGEKVGEVAIGTTRAVHEVVVPARAVRKGPDRVVLRFTKWSRPSAADYRHLAALFDHLAIRQDARAPGAEGNATITAPGSTQPRPREEGKR